MEWNGRTASTAFQRFELLRRKHGDPDKVREYKYKLTTPLDELLEHENKHRRDFGSYIREHTCDKPLCNGEVAGWVTGLGDSLRLTQATG